MKNLKSIFSLKSLLWNKSILGLSIEFFWVVSGQISGVIGSLLLLRFLTDSLTPSEYGELSLVLTFSGFVNQVVMGGITVGVARFYPIAVEKYEVVRYFSSVTKLMAISSLFVIILGICTTVLLLIEFNFYNSIWLVIFTILFSILSSYVSILASILSAARKRAMVAFYIGLDSILKIVLIFVTVKYYDNSSTAIIIGFTISSICILFTLLIFLKKIILKLPTIQNEVNRINWVKDIWTFSWPFSFFGIFTWLQQASDRWALKFFSSTSELGQYTAVFQIGFTPIGLITGFFVTLIGPILFEKTGSLINKGSNTRVRFLLFRLISVCLLFTIVAVIFTYIFHGLIFKIFVGEEFHAVSYLLPWVVFSGGLFSAGQIISLNYMNELATQKLIIPKIVTAIIGMSGNIFGAFFYGIEGVVYSLFLFSFVYFLWIGISVLKQTKKIVS